MTPIYIALAVAIACVVGFFWIRSRANPSVAMLGEIQWAVLDLQIAASRNIVPIERSDKITGFDEEEMDRQCRRVGGMLQFIYTISESEAGMEHLVSSRLLKRKPEKYQVQCMLFVILTLNRRLADAGIDPKSVEFSVDRSDLGTHYVGLTLSRDQHDRMIAYPGAA